MNKPNPKPKHAFETDEVWRLWQRVSAAFSVLRMLVSFLRPRGQFWTSFDSLRPLRRSGALNDIGAIVATTDDATLEALRDMARLNWERQSAFLRIILIAYFSIPIGFAAVWAQVDPGGITASLLAYPSFWAGGFAGLTTAVLGRFLHDARARDLTAGLELLLIERRARAALAQN